MKREAAEEAFELQREEMKRERAKADEEIRQEREMRKVGLFLRTSCADETNKVL